MKTASKILPILGLALIATGAHAQNAAPSIVAPPSAEMAISNLSDNDIGDKNGKGLSQAEDQALNQAKGVVKRLNTTENMSLEDLNSAHQAIAKIDALIDLEKRIHELEKLRGERDGKGMLASAIPASALAAPARSSAPYAPQNGTPTHVSQQSFVPSSPAEVSRIIGTQGHYTAYIKTGEGPAKPVSVGDTVSGHGTVVAITPSSVDFELNHARHSLKIKNVRMVFGGTP